jgi:hypothetical protein
MRVRLKTILFYTVMIISSVFLIQLLLLITLSIINKEIYSYSNNTSYEEIYKFLNNLEINEHGKSICHHRVLGVFKG